MFPKQKRVQNRALLDAVKKQPCLAMGRGCLGDVVSHHITTVGAGGHDVESNLAPLCVLHHSEWHQGLSKFIDRYPVVLLWLEKNDRWDIIDKVNNLEFSFTKQA